MLVLILALLGVVLIGATSVFSVQALRDRRQRCLANCDVLRHKNALKWIFVAANALQTAVTFLWRHLSAVGQTVQKWVVSQLIDEAKDLPVFWAHFAICFKKNVWLARKRLFSFTAMHVLLPVLWVSPMAFGYVYGQRAQYDFGSYASEVPTSSDISESFDPSTRLVDLNADVWQNEAFACHIHKQHNTTWNGLKPCPENLKRTFVPAAHFMGTQSQTQPDEMRDVLKTLSGILGSAQGGKDTLTGDADVLEELQKALGRLDPEDFDLSQLQNADLTQIFDILKALGVDPLGMGDGDGDDAEEEDEDAPPEPPAFLSNFFQSKKDNLAPSEPKPKLKPKPPKAKREKKKVKKKRTSKELQKVGKLLKALEKMLDMAESAPNATDLMCLEDASICLRNFSNHRAVKAIQGMWGVSARPFAVPNLNSFLLFRFLSRSALQPQKSAPLSLLGQKANAINRFLRSGDKLFITPSNHTTARAFRSYLRKNSLFAPLILGDPAGVTEAYTAADVIRAAQKDTALSNSIWSIIDFSQPSTQIMLREDIIPNTNLKLLPRLDDRTDHPSAYFASGFLTLQKAVANFFLEFEKNSKKVSGQRLEAHPPIVFAPVEAPSSSNSILSQLGNQLALSFAMALLLFFLSIIKSFVEEKECGRQSVLRVMGLLHAAYTLSTLGFYALVGAVTALLVSGVLQYTVFPNTPLYMLVTFIALYIASLVASAYFLSTFFSKSKTASMVTPLLYFLSALPVMFRFPSPGAFASMKHIGARVASSDIAKVYAETTGSQLTIPAALSLFNLLFFINIPFSSTTVLSWAIDLIVYHETRGSSLGFRNAVSAVADETPVRYPFLLFAAYPAGNVEAGITQSFFPGEKSVTKAYFSAFVLVWFFLTNILSVTFVGYCLDRLFSQESAHRWVSPLQIPFIARCAAFFKNLWITRLFRDLWRQTADQPEVADEQLDESIGTAPLLAEGAHEETLKGCTDNSKKPTVSLVQAYKEYPMNTSSWNTRTYGVLSYLLPFLLFWISLGLLIVKKVTNRQIWRFRRSADRPIRPRIIKAVDGIDFQAYENEITVLLGVNGAGKSTTMAMLTGLINPTKIGRGSHVYGKPLGKTALGAAPNLVGFCAQGNDALWPMLTVAEHIEFYFAMKEGGRGERNLRSAGEAYSPDIAELLDILQLRESLETPAGTLSGGQKRRLLFLLAFLSQEYNKLIVLDEPTAGIDINVRHCLWNFLLRMKQRDKTIIISTHYMEEAEVLGDSIILIKDGRIRAQGSSADLKKSVGKGYLLKVSIDAKDMQKNSLIAEYMQSLAQDIRVVSSCAGEIQFAVPSSVRAAIPSVLENLEAPEVQKRFGILNVGISNTTLEEVFLELCGATDAQDDSPLLHTVEEPLKGDKFFKDQHSGPIKRLWDFSTTFLSYIFSSANPVVTRLCRWKPLAHIRVLIGKKHKNTTRDKIFWFYSMLFPLFLLLVLLMGWDRAMDKVSKGEIDGDLTGDEFSLAPREESLLSSIQQIALRRNTFATRWPTAMDFSMNRVFYAKGKKHRLRLCADDLRLPALSPRVIGKCQLGKNMTAKDSKGYVDMWQHVHFPKSDETVRLQRFLSSAKALVAPIVDKESSYGRKRFAYATGLYYPAANDDRPRRVVWYRTDALHSPPRLLNDIYAEAYPDSTHKMVVSHPLRLPRKEPGPLNSTLPSAFTDVKGAAQSRSDAPVVAPNILQSVHSLTLSIFLTLPIAFIPPAFLPFLIKEHSSGMRHLQALAGVSRISYWVANFVYDLLMIVVATHTAILLTLRAFGRFEYVGSLESLLATSLLLFLYTTASLSFVYLSSKFFQNPNTGSNFVRVLFSVSGYFLLLCTLVLRASESAYYAPLHALFASAFPTYSLGDGLLGLSIRYILRLLNGPGQIPVEEWDKVAAKEGFRGFGRPSDYQNIFAPMVTGNAMLYLLMQTMVFSLLLLISEQSIWEKLQSIVVAKLFLPEEVKQTEPGWQPGERTAITTKHVSKAYLHRNIIVEGIVYGLQRFALTGFLRRLLRVDSTKRETIALQNFSLAVHSGEKFGFLGINGAGKTTTMRILSKNVLPTFGLVQLGKFQSSLSRGRHQALEAVRVGYCPQTDCLFDFLTPYEHLELFYDLRECANAHDSLRAALHADRAHHSSHTEGQGAGWSSWVSHMKAALEAKNQNDRKKKKLIYELLRDMQLLTHMDCIHVGEKLSGGNKRRLNGLIALLGTNIWLLDEPSAGLDPIGRRQYWNLINALRATQQTGPTADNSSGIPGHIVCVPSAAPTLFLATHHMEEVEAICSRAMIIHKTPPTASEENANVMADGSVLHVKEKLGAGYEITMHVKEDSRSTLSDAIDRSNLIAGIAEAIFKNDDAQDQQFGPVDLVEPLENRIGLFRVKVRTERHKIRLSRLFKAMQALLELQTQGQHNPYGLMDFTISQISLESAFMDLHASPVRI